MHQFKKLIFWQKSIQLAKNIYLACTEIPHEEKFGLISQIKIAAISIPSNIAEGAGRNSNTELQSFFRNCKWSSFELQTQLILIKELELIKEEKSKHFIIRIK